MTKKQKSLILIILVLVLTITTFVSCDNNDGKVLLSPESGLYTIYFGEEWQTLTTENPYQLILSDSELGFVLTIDCYMKTNVIEQDITDLDSYIETYKQFGVAQELYALNQADAMESFKEKQILNGKRQKIHIEGREEEHATYIDSTSEFIYFETKDFYFTVIYGNTPDKFDASQKKINDAIKTLKFAK